jgi:putative transposase
MPRRKRLIVPGLPHHITQRGNNRGQVFDSDTDRQVFLDLLGRYSQQYSLAIWSYCLMTNHVHLVAEPASERSTRNVLGRLEADYARYLNVRRRTSGHLWQARFYSVPMDFSHCWRAIAYVERNPVRAGIVETAEEYRWSSAAPRIGVREAPVWLDLDRWREQWTVENWLELGQSHAGGDAIGVELREATLTGYPLGEELVNRLEAESGRALHRGRGGRPPGQIRLTGHQTLLFG